jgi:hypothetical protein
LISLRKKIPIIETYFFVLAFKNKMRDKGKRKLVITTLLIYCGALLLQDFSAFFETKALEQNVPHINIVAILVDDKIYNSIQDDLERYSTQYIQQEIPDSKALVMPLNLDNIDSPQIYKMLENIYFDGLDGVNSTLLGTVLVGGIPLPVVNQEGYIFPSMYPYVDFVDQKFVRDPVEKYFLPNGNQNGQAEIWHGLVDYGTDITAYHQFFAKLKKYKTNPNSFIGEDIWYEDILANKQGFLEDNLQYYQNKVLFSEDIGYQRFTPLMLQLFQAGQANSMNDITDDLFDSFTELGGSGMSDIMTYTGSDGKVVSTSIKDTLGQSSEKSVSTKTVEKSVKTSFLLDYPSLYSVQNSVILRDNTLAGGRRIKEYTDSDGQKNLQAKADSSIDKINLKDTVNMGSDSLKGILISFNERLENAVDKKIKDEKYDMDIVLPISYETTQAEKVGGCKRVLGIKVCKNKTNKNLDSKYEVFYFGKSANLIQSAQELSIYRGSFRNLTGLNNVLYPLLPSSANNPVKSLQDKTNLQNKSIGASYDIFSTQVEANRGYNLANTQQEYERYEENKSYAKWDLTCAKWRPFSRWKMVCTKIESKPVLSDGKPMEKNDQGECSPYDLANGYAINSKENMRDASCELPG